MTVALISPFLSVASAWSAPATAPGTNSTIAGTLSSPIDIAPFATSFEFGPSYAELTTTNFASGGFEEFMTGLASGMVSINFLQSFAASNVNAIFGVGGTLGPQPGSRTVFYLEARPTTGARSATNPGACVALINMGIPFITGSVGELIQVQAQFRVTGKFASLTS